MDNIEEYIRKYFNYENEELSMGLLLNNLINLEAFNICSLLCSYFIKKYPNNITLKEQYALSLQHTGDHLLSHNFYKKVIEQSFLGDNQIKKILLNDRKNLYNFLHKFTYYPYDKIQQILRRHNNTEDPLITLTITTCKRYDLFERTINSFINCCQDINKIDRWICVDDNSSEDERKLMKNKYPFFDFYFKTLKEKGHPHSMNIIRNMVNTPYVLHLEDDWEFFLPDNIIDKSIQIINYHPFIGQCLFNQNYGETIDDIDIIGGMLNKLSNGYPFYIHENLNIDKFTEKYGFGKNCAYWPGFSFRPSIFRSSIFNKLGEFNEKIAHFEMDYSKKYKDNGYLSAFLYGIRCIHTGRLTSEINNPDKPNAYTLNGEQQFTKDFDVNNESNNIIDFKDIKQETIDYLQNKMVINIVNLDKRLDRWEDIQSFTNNFKFFSYNRFKAIDGYSLKPNIHLSKLFDGNDYNMRKGMVGCALSHIQLAINLLNSDKELYLVLEDDIKFVDNFEEKLCYLYENLDKEWDLVYIGHHIKKEYITENTFNTSKFPLPTEKLNSKVSLSKSLGGTIGYLLSRMGAQKMLNFIESRGMTNGIDTIQQKMADEANIYYCEPHLIYSDCANNNNVDSDIQYDYSSLTLNFDERYNIEKDFYSNIVSKLFIDLPPDRILEIISDDNLEEVSIAILYDDRKYQKLPLIINIIKEKKIPINLYTINNEGALIINKKGVNTENFLNNRSILKLAWIDLNTKFWMWSIDKMLEN